MRALWAATSILGLVGLGALAQNFPQNGPPGFPPNGPQNYPQYPPQGYPQSGPPNTSSDPNEAATDADSASHGVGRLSLMNGSVSVAHGDAGQMAGAVVNAPLLTGDRVLTGADGRAEVEFDGANLVRVAGSTELRMGDLEYKHFQVQIAQGLVTFRVLRDNDAQVEISTPTVAVHPLRQGIYRVSVSPDGLTEVTVRAGEAEIASPTGSEQLQAGQTMQSRGSASDPEFRTASAPVPDDWDRFNADRDRAFENNGDLARYVSPDVYGAEDLGAYGRWTYDPAYGNVWVPNEGPDWAPYQQGRWSYLDYYGWTWVSYDPWGWAPYHYGRWYRGSFGWAWYPGAIGARYYWRPALVGFFGWGAPGFGVSFGFGFANVGWVPLAPFEAFHPWYGRGFGGFRNTAIVNNTNIASVYRNARFNGAVTSMRAGEFGRSAVSGSNLVRASSADLAHAGMMSGGVPVAASRESRVFGAASGNFQGTPRTNQNTRFFSTSSMRSAGGSAGVRGSATGGISGGASAAGSAGGWRRFDPSSSGGAGFQRSGSTGGGSQNGGFQRPAGGGFQSGASFSRGGGFQSPANGFGGGSAGASQAVRIAPPIVTNRSQGSATQGSNGAASGGFSGFGGPRPSFNGNSGNGNSAPRAPQGGGSRGAPSGGGGHSGGGRSAGGRR
jgi:hypothetical protein